MDSKIEPQRSNDALHETSRQDIFEQRFHELMDIFSEQCERHGVQTAMAIALHPAPLEASQEEIDRFKHPMVFFRGEILESMALAATVLRNFKSHLSESLDTNPR